MSWPTPVEALTIRGLRAGVGMLHRYPQKNDFRQVATPEIKFPNAACP